MPNIPHYICTTCSCPTKRDDLTVKRVMFTTMGEGPKTIRSRVIEWLCPDCRQVDADWNREKAHATRV